MGLQVHEAWSFFTPVAIYFGEGIGRSVAQRYRHQQLLLLTSAGMTQRGIVERIKSDWQPATIHVCDKILSNPEANAIDTLAAELREGVFEAIIAVGGGSVLDAAKALGLLLACDASFTLKDHFVKKLPIPSTNFVPVVAIPTTSGTGSEVTPFATIWDFAIAKKYSLADSRLFPKVAILDPTYTCSLPWEITLSSGLDALCQGMESIWNRNANPVTQALGFEAVVRAWRALGHGRAILSSIALRRTLMEASLLSGLAISHTRTALCHSVSYPITARFGVPHGLACAFTLPAVLRWNIPIDDGRLSALARHLECSSAEELSFRIEDLLRQLDVSRSLRGYISDPACLLNFVSEMITVGRTENNLRAVTESELRRLLAGYLERFFS